MQLTNGKRYAARIDLGILESLASNDDIRAKFEEVGFVDVQVTGTGRIHSAVGTWSGATGEIGNLPSQIIEVSEVNGTPQPPGKDEPGVTPTGGLGMDPLVVVGLVGGALLLWFLVLKGRK